jgi:DNA segregation ATPase FtsK/SpoIIIE, S-DNA-T family
MNGRNLYEQEREALRELLRLVADRAAREQACRDKFEAAKVEANREVAKARKNISADRERDRQSITTAWDEARRSIQEKFNNETAAADKLRDFTIQEAQDRARTEEEKTKAALSDALWTADSMYEAAEKQADEQLETLRRKAAAGAEALDAARREAAPYLRRGGLSLAELQPDPNLAPPAQDDPLSRLEAGRSQARDAVDNLRDQRSLRRAGVSGFILWFVVFNILGAIPAVVVAQEKLFLILGGIVGAIMASLLAHAVVRAKALRRCREQAVRLATALAYANQAREELLKTAAAEYQAAMQEGARQRSVKKAKAQEKYPPQLVRTGERLRAEAANAEDKHERDAEKHRTWQYETLKKAENHFSPMLQQCLARHDAALAEAEKAFEQRKAAAQQERAAQWNELARQWREGQDRVLDAVNHLRAAERESFLPWDAPYWKDFPPAEQVPKGIHFGTIAVDMKELPGGVPEGADLAPTLPVHMDLPAYLPFPERSSLVIRAAGPARDLAVQQLQALMLRYLTALPAGKARFTVIDPVGLGDNFAAFMHLADYDENLIGARIWTETAQIEKRLADLTAHMENVIQKYLRNQYKSIEEYNAQAGEVAEPFRILVVANFPANFNLEAARRLVSIVQSGPTCGVCSIISIDTKMPPPQGFNVADLEQGSLTLTWKDDKFVWKDADFQRYPLTLKPPPAADEIVRLVRIVGQRGKDANRVEVPFDSVMPRPENIWKSDSRKSVAVPIGRSGATKLQQFLLGVGTAQHALVAGKTGSGKSTLLHALITNLALYYSPDEMELYLIDFKKGVEFKAYAESQLPHAKVVAIESEREFGLSVLQRLDLELRQRGDRFRDAGANDVASYRAFLEARAPGAPNEAGHPATCPRIMLIVDEFQEFFVEDDRISQETALLLDRLVRQGRAFGMHVLLGSQTLGGAYSLARSTIDQMAVRIALQCSDADAQLILNKDNTAARLLSRPGEAIYNDANGLVEGNDLFQIVYLSDTRREELLQEIHARAQKRGAYLPPLVFEGNTVADLANNALLAKLLQAPAWPTELRAVSAWMGEAIAIKDPTAAVFRNHSGNHLLVVGQNEESALAIFSANLISLAAQRGPAAQFIILDGTMDDDPNAGQLGRVAATLPHTIDFVGFGQVAEPIARLGALVAARQKGEQSDRSPRFLMIHGIQRFRELRKEDDMGFGRRGADRVVSPAEHFGNILREGPAVGVHVLVWCDVLTNLNRYFDRQLLREFAMRVIFQMNANDSSTLIDVPIASRLGRNRALFVTEEMPAPEKFRPYGLPSANWLKDVKAALARTSAEPAHA